MAQNYGLMNDFAQGIKEGLIGLQTINAQKKQQQQFNVLHGTQEDEQGNLQYKPEIEQQMQQKRQVESQQLKRSQEEADPESLASKNAQATGRGLLAKSLGLSPQDAQKYIPDTMSAKEIMGEGGLLKSAISGGFSMQGAQAKAEGFKSLTDVKRNQFEESQNKSAAGAGKDFEHDPIIKLSKITKNSLDRAESVLNKEGAPVTAKDFNLAMNDYINSVDSAGKATEGKIHREMPEAMVLSWNEVKQRLGENDDLRQDPKGKQLIDFLKNNIGIVRKDISNATAEQALNIHDSNKYSTNEKVKQTIKDKLKTYNPQAYAEIYGGGQKGLINQPSSQIQSASPEQHPEDSAAVQWARSNPNDPRAQAILKANGVK